MRTRRKGFSSNCLHPENIRLNPNAGLTNPGSASAIHPACGSRLAWACAALLTACFWAPSAFCQAAYTVKEPAAPNPSPAVASVLAETESLRQTVHNEEALAAADRALAAALKAGDPAGEALSDSARASALESLGRAAEAAAAWQAAAGAWERAGDGPGQIQPLVWAGLYFLAVDSAQGSQLLARALLVGKVERQRRFAAAKAFDRAATRLRACDPALLRNAPDADAFAGAAVALRHEARVGQLLDEDHCPEAEAVARQRLAEVEAASGSGSLETAQALDVLAGALFVVKTAEIPEKIRLALRALAIREKLLGPNHIDVAQSLYTLGRVLWQAGEYREARLKLERALVIRQQVLGPRHGAVRILVAFLAAVLSEMGDCAAALPLAEQFVAFSEKAYGSDHPFYGRSLQVLFRAYYCAGNYTEARRVTERGIAIKVKAWGENNASVASDRVNLGQLLLEIGDSTEAGRNYERALAVYEKLYGPESANVAEVLGGMARVAASSGDSATARTLQERAVTVFEKVLGPDHPDLGMPLINLAITLTRAGEYAKAQPLYERALTLWEQSRGYDSPYVATAIVQLAGLLQQIGETRRAAQLYERALSIQEKTFGPTHATVAETLRGLARGRAMSGDADAAFTLALRAEQMGREHWQLIATTLSEREALAFARERSSSLDLVLTLAAREKSEARSAWDELVRSRALVLDEMASRHRTVLESADPETARLAGQFTSARERLARLVVRGPATESPESYHKLLDDTRQEEERAERAIAERSQAFRETLARARIGFDEVAAALPPGAALVAYARYRHLDFTTGEPGSKRPDPVPRYLAFVWRGRHTQPRIVSLGPAGPIDAMVTAVRRQIAQESTAPGRADKRSEAEYRLAGARLRRAVWSPVAPYLGSVRRVFVVPDGALDLVNFAALPTGQSSYLLETGPRIHYLSAERDLVPVGPEETTGVGLLAIGAPAFQDANLFAALRSPKKASEVAAQDSASGATPFRGLRSSCDDFRAMQFEELSASARETGDVAALWQRSGGMLRGARSSAAVQLTGTAASESAFKQQAAGKRVLHLATHGFFLGGNCVSALEASRKPGEEGLFSPTGENPLLLSGFALAGANQRQAAGPGEEDGILTAEEIATLDLSGVEWAVLSACDTGVGEVRAGEGVLGLRRAFQVAGARTLIMSLWPVEDQLTRDWMRRLYRARLLLGLTTIDAVHQANLSTLRQRRARGQSTHPFYWAGFVAAGDWR